jgi:protein-S-isoprenylcysteine O-methyltransferase Ste14
MFIFKIIVAILYNIAIFGGLLFLPAGTLEWWRAWMFLGIVFVGTVVTMVGVFRNNEDLLNERSKLPVQQGQPLVDKILVVLILALFFGVIVFIPLDVLRFHLLGKPGAVVSSLGLLLFVSGWGIISLSFKANPFAVPVVKLQEERHQRVIDSGVYGMVRHPMYAGAVLVMVGMPLWLESYAAALLAILPSGLLVLRILAEEQFLRQELEGYDAYMERVRCRLLPYLW